ncbi:MAG: tetratricopeptide repeat protein [Candidatus Poseidoniaceae archaeon]
MQECRVCGLLFLGGGACPSCGSQVAMDITVDDIVMDDETIPGLEEIADAIGDATLDVDKSEVLPFGMGAKAEVIESSLPFGVGSFTSEVNEVAIPYSHSDLDSETSEEEIQIDSVETEPVVVEQTGLGEVVEINEPTHVVEETSSNSPELTTTAPTVNNESIGNVVEDVQIKSNDDIAEPSSIEYSSSKDTFEIESNESPVSVRSPDVQPTRIVADLPGIGVAAMNGTNVTEATLAEEVPDLWKIDAAEVDMDAIYSQEEQIVEVNFDNDLDSGDVQVSFDDFHHSPVEESMASDEDAPQLHPAKALAVESSGQPEISRLVNTAFEHIAKSSWMQAAQILSTASNNRPNDPAILNNLGLSLLQSALEMDSKNDPMSSSQYEAAIMALRQGAKIDSRNNTILLNLSHALLVSGRAEKALKVINVLRSREANNLEVENTLGACLIQLGRDEEAQLVLQPFSSDTIVAGNLSLI